jgi:hypothetical protein
MNNKVRMKGGIVYLVEKDKTTIFDPDHPRTETTTFSALPRPATGNKTESKPLRRSPRRRLRK